MYSGFLVRQAAVFSFLLPVYTPLRRKLIFISTGIRLYAGTTLCRCMTTGSELWNGGNPLQPDACRFKEPSIWIGIDPGFKG
jgi:hypothetical protein